MSARSYHGRVDQAQSTVLKDERRKTFFDALSNSVRPFDYMVKAGQLARPKTALKIDSLNH
jgi:hypothetical protein